MKTIELFTKYSYQEKLLEAIIVYKGFIWDLMWHNLRENIALTLDL